MPEITDLKAGSVPTEGELLGMLEKARPWAEAVGFINYPREGGEGLRHVGVVLHEDVAGLSEAMFIVEAAKKCILALPSLIAAKAQAEAKVKGLLAVINGECCRVCQTPLQAGPRGDVDCPACNPDPARG